MLSVVIIIFHYYYYYDFYEIVYRFSQGNILIRIIKYWSFYSIHLNSLKSLRNWKAIFAHSRGLPLNQILLEKDRRIFRQFYGFKSVMAFRNKEFLKDTIYLIWMHGISPNTSTRLFQLQQLDKYAYGMELDKHKILYNTWSERRNSFF